MNLIHQHLDKKNLHHAYLVEGERDKIVPEIIKFCEGINIKTSGNPDFVRITIDNFKIDEAFDLRAMSSDKGFSSAKKIFVLCANSFSLDAQNVLLKIFEEPTKNTHFFLVVPDSNALLKTLVSRFYLIKTAPTPEGIGAPIENVGEKFITMPLRNRIDFIKELLVEPEEGDISIEIGTDGIRLRAMKFLNALEIILHEKLVSKAGFDTQLFEHFFKVREFLRLPGSSAKNLLESVALMVPIY